MRPKLLSSVLAAVVATALGLGAAAAPAGAASWANIVPAGRLTDSKVTFGGEDEPRARSILYTYAADRWEHRWDLTDPEGVTLAPALFQWTPKAGCVSSAATAATCVGPSHLSASTGPRGGSVTVGGGSPGRFASVDLSGEGGDDTFLLGPNVLATVLLSAGRDFIAGEPRHVRPVVPAAWADRPVDVDLAAGIVRHGADVTRMTGVTSFEAQAPAHVVGSADADHVHIGGGDIDSGAGDDVVSGSGTAFRTGSGDDFVEVSMPSRHSRGATTSISCGPGTDTVKLWGREPAVGADCERLRMFQWLGERSWIDPRPHRVAGHDDRLRFRVSCATPVVTGCHGSLRVGRVRVRVDVARGHHASVTLAAARGQRVAVGAPLHMRMTSSEGDEVRSWSAPVVR